MSVPYKSHHLPLSYLHFPQCPVTSGLEFLLALKLVSLEEQKQYFRSLYMKTSQTTSLNVKL